jgi:Flp pilus assembly protein CpaB
MHAIILGMKRINLMRLKDWQKLLIVFLVLLFAATGSWHLLQRSKDTKIVYVPARNLPAYYLIQETDLITKTLPLEDLSEGVLTLKDDLINHYTLETLMLNEVVSKSKVITPPSLDLIQNTTAVSVPATAAATFNGQLTSGSIVTAWASYPTNKPAINKAEIILQRVLVLDVQKTEDSRNHPYIVILAVPINKQVEVLGAAASGPITFTLTP